MTGKQNTRAQKARRAARSAGAKYTAQLRAQELSESEQVAALLPPHMIALLNVVVTVEPGTDPHAVAEQLAAAVLTLPAPTAAIVRPYDVPLSDAESAEHDRFDRPHPGLLPDDPDGEHLTFLMEAFYLTGGLPDNADQVARRPGRALARPPRREPRGARPDRHGGRLFGPGTYEALYRHRLDWDVRTPDPHALVPPQAQTAGPRPSNAAPAVPGEPMANEEVARVLHISAVFLPAILGTGCRFYRAPNGAIEQRSAEGLVRRWEQTPDGAVHQVVYDRDGVEDTRLLTGLTTLHPAAGD